MHSLEIRPVDSSNLHIYNNLIQCYECEFSSITGKSPDSEGIFPLDTEIGGCVEAFIGFLEDTPVAVAAIKKHQISMYEVCEFFVVPCFRRRHLGELFAERIWLMRPGNWEVKQIEGASHAVSFWRNVIERFSRGSYTEDIFNDDYWGPVTRQTFVSDPKL